MFLSNAVLKEQANKWWNSGTAGQGSSELSCRHDYAIIWQRMEVPRLRLPGLQSLFNGFGNMRQSQPSISCLAIIEHAVGSGHFGSQPHKLFLGPKKPKRLFAHPASANQLNNLP